MQKFYFRNVKFVLITNICSGMLSRNKSESRVALKVIVDLVALCFQVSGFFVWPIIEYRKDPTNTDIWLLPVAIFLTSFGWWENYVDRQSKFRKSNFVYSKI